MNHQTLSRRPFRVEQLDDRVVPAVIAPLSISGNNDNSSTPLLYTADSAGAYGTTPTKIATVFSYASRQYPLPADGTGVAIIRSAVGDVNGDGKPDTILVTGPGVPVQVAVVSGADNQTILVAPFEPYGSTFNGGGFVATGDLTGTGRSDIVISADNGGGPRVSVFHLPATGPLTTIADFYGIDDPNFRGGARVAVGDVNGDARADLVVAAGFGGGPRIAIYDGSKLGINGGPKLVGDFFAFEPELRNGTYVAVGDMNADGFGDLVFGAGPGGGPRVMTISSSRLLSSGPAAAIANPLNNFFVAGNTSDRGGVRVAVVNADGDTKADIVTGSGLGYTARIYLGKNFTGTGEPAQFQALAPFGYPVSDGLGGFINPPVPDGIYVG